MELTISKMDFEGKSSSTMSRPNCWNFDLISAASSGYCTAEHSTESEFPPFDFESVRDKLQDLENLQVEIQPQYERQFMKTDCFFAVKIHSKLMSINYRKYFNTLEAHVVGPSGSVYEVRQDPGSEPSQLICTFRPLECGPHTCHVTLLHSQFSDPPPFVLNIERSYHDVVPIITMDAELSTPEYLAYDAAPSKMISRKPWGICSSKKTENIYVADRENHVIMVFGPDGSVMEAIGEQGDQAGQFYRPTAVAYDEANDRILVADKDNHRIQIFTPEGKFLFSFGRKGKYCGQFFFPWGVAASRDGKLIAVADSRNHRIQLFDQYGSFIRKYSAPDPKEFKKEFDYPRGVAFDVTGENVYVTDFNLHCLFKLSIDFKTCTKVLNSQQLKRPQGVTVDDCGNVLVCDSRNHSIKIVNQDGQFIQEIQRLGPKLVDLPLDVEVMKGGYMTMMDMNGRIQIF